MHGATMSFWDVLTGSMPGGRWQHFKSWACSGLCRGFVISVHRASAIMLIMSAHTLLIMHILHVFSLFAFYVSFYPGCHDLIDCCLASSPVLFLMTWLRV
jgi:hypothetical protein